MDKLTKLLFDKSGLIGIFTAVVKTDIRGINITVSSGKEHGTYVA